MYKCECCGATFDEPYLSIERNTIEGHTETLRARLCPWCQGPYFKEFFPYEVVEKYIQREEQAKAARREYMRKWRAKNKDKVREINARYWQRRAEKLQEEKK